MRKRLIDPRILATRKKIGPTKSFSRNLSRNKNCGSLLVSCPVENHQVGVVQATCNIERLRSAMNHGRDQEFLLLITADNKNGNWIMPTNCLDLTIAFDLTIVFDSVLELVAILQRAANLIERATWNREPTNASILQPNMWCKHYANL